ncbi:MAG TPA: ZIP family metal transporter [Dyella sp.]|nr:ZIP family metal transporter [Dyella sp.]
MASIVTASVALAARMLVWVPQRSLGPLLPWLQSFAAGLLIGDALLHMLPEALNQGIAFKTLGECLTLGLLGLFIIEYAIRTFGVGPAKAPFARSNIIGDVVHHFVDGVIIAASFSINISVGLVVTIAIMLHELPREISNAGVLMAGGYSRDEAFLITLATTGAVPLGALSMSLTGHPSLLGGSLAFAAGTTLYLACGDLIPALWNYSRQDRTLAPPVGIGSGVVLMWVAALFDYSH